MGKIYNLNGIEIEYSCADCLRRHYGRGPTKYVPDGTLKREGWIIQIPEGTKKTACTECGTYVLYPWKRDVKREANH